MSRFRFGLGIPMVLAAMLLLAAGCDGFNFGSLLDGLGGVSIQIDGGDDGIVDDGDEFDDEIDGEIDGEHDDEFDEETDGEFDDEDEFETGEECGNGVCEEFEDSCLCEADCGVGPDTETDCGNDFDDDCDGFFDCDDEDCIDDPGCL